MTQAQRKYDVVAAGRAFVDVIGQGSEALVHQYGIPLGNGRYFSVEETKEIIQQLDGRTICAGGATPNTIAGLASLGAKTALFGKCARDEMGQVFLDDMQARGIDAACEPVVPGAPMSGTCVCILSEGGERSFALNKGCVEDFTAADFDGFDFAQASYYLVHSKSLLDSPVADLLASSMLKARRAGTKIVVSLSEVRDWSVKREMLHDVVVPSCDILIGNEAEVEAMQREAGALDAARYVFVTTLGTRGATARQAGQEVHVPIFEVPNFVNSLGAGDQFLAGFIKGQIDGRDLRGSLQLAARCAAEIVGMLEARPPLQADWRAFLTD